jgi:hypothetical protein
MVGVFMQPSQHAALPPAKLTVPSPGFRSVIYYKCGLWFGAMPQDEPIAPRRAQHTREAGPPRAATCDRLDDAHSRGQERILGAGVLDRSSGSRCPGLSSAGQKLLSRAC